MRKKLLILMLFLVLPVFTQFQSQVNQWRVVTISPNYRNVYPRFSTMQNAFNSCVDSANAGKYFIINIASAVQNITDYTSQWKDSITAHYPYMVLTAFGVTVNDSITAVTPEEFTLIAGLLSLNGAIAGAGLSFSSHQLALITQNYLGNALYVDGDSLKIRVQSPIYFTPNLLGIDLKFNSGLLVDTGGIGVQVYKPLYVSHDTTFLRLSYQFQSTDSLWTDYNPNQFYLVYGSSPAVNLLLDSGLTSSASGVRAWLDNSRVKFTSAGKITLPSSLAGTGLIWTGDSLNVGLSYLFQPYNDSLWIDFNTQQFNLVYGSSPAVNIKLDSGMTSASTGIKPKIDYATLIFNSLLQLAVNPVMAGGGLLMTSGVIDIVPNEFGKIENDTLKIKTSAILTWWGDTLTTNMTNGSGCFPYDTTGIPMFAGGHIKRAVITYQLASGNDTVITQSDNIGFNSTDKLRIKWVNGSSRFTVQKWTLGLRNWADQFNILAPGFASNKWSVGLEAYWEAQ